WKDALQKDKRFKWKGAGDRVHFDAQGTIVEEGTYAIAAFQRLWNANNPCDMINADGIFGAETEEKLRQSPVGGFVHGSDTPPMAVDGCGGSGMYFTSFVAEAECMTDKYEVECCTVSDGSGVSNHITPCATDADCLPP